MTVIEKQYMNSVININRMMRKAQDGEPDWEQRRYEIAKEIYTHKASHVYYAQNSEMAKDAVLQADALIDELKRTAEKN